MGPSAFHNVFPLRRILPRVKQQALNAWPHRLQLKILENLIQEGRIFTDPQTAPN
jgi:hypothetical protein